MRRILRNLTDRLNSIDIDRNQDKLPIALWKAGDLQQELVASHAKIGRIRERWEVQGVLWLWRWTILTIITTRPN